MKPVRAAEKYFSLLRLFTADIELQISRLTTILYFERLSTISNEILDPAHLRRFLSLTSSPSVY